MDRTSASVNAGPAVRRTLPLILCAKAVPGTSNMSDAFDRIAWLSAAASWDCSTLPGSSADLEPGCVPAPDDSAGQPIHSAPLRNPPRETILYRAEALS